MNAKLLLLGIDGGGTRCRARLCAFSGDVLGEAMTGPANLRLGLERSFSAIVDAAVGSLKCAGLGRAHLGRTVACLALAGASEPAYLAAAQEHPHPFCKVVVTTDAHAACLGAHGQRDGAIIIAGTGAIGWAVRKGQSHRIGGWGLPLSDEGGGAWLGCEALRRVLWALDGRSAWTELSRALAAEFANDPHAIVSWAQTALPRDLASLAPLVFDHAGRGDPLASELMDLAARHLDALAERLVSTGATRLALVGGCARFLKPWLSEATQSHLVTPKSDALHGAVQLARFAAQSLARVA